MFQRCVLPPSSGRWVSTSETLVNINLTTRLCIPEDSKLHTRRRENLKSHVSVLLFCVVTASLNFKTACDNSRCHDYECKDDWLSSEMCIVVWQNLTNVSEVLTASIIRNHCSDSGGSKLSEIFTRLHGLIPEHSHFHGGNMFFLNSGIYLYDHATLLSRGPTLTSFLVTMLR
jgi:hypothetical protein